METSFTIGSKLFQEFRIKPSYMSEHYHDKHYGSVQYKQEHKNYDILFILTMDGDIYKTNKIYRSYNKLQLHFNYITSLTASHKLLLLSETKKIFDNLEVLTSIKDKRIKNEN